MQKNAIIGVIAVVVIVAIAVPLASPLFIKGDSANEPLPDGAITGELNEPVMDDTMMDDDKMGDTMDDKMTGEMEDTQMTDEEMKKDMMSEDGSVSEGIRDAEKAIEGIMMDLEKNGDNMTEDQKQMLTDMMDMIKESGVTAKDTMMKEEMPDVMPAEKQEEMQIKKYEGMFIGADKGSHNVMGDVSTVPTTEGKTFLRLAENFSTGNGPHLVVYLVPGYEKGGSVNDRVELGNLKGTSGAQNYEIPPGTDLEKYNTALIWCEPFSALFGYAPLKSQ